MVESISRNDKIEDRLPFNSGYLREALYFQDNGFDRKESFGGKVPNEDTHYELSQNGIGRRETVHISRQVARNLSDNIRISKPNKIENVIVFATQN